MSHESDATRDPTRRRLVLAGLGSAALPLLSTLSSLSHAADGAETLRIGYQKSSTLMIWLKSRETLEKALAPLKVNVQWHEFTSGLPLLESLNVNNLDLTADVADAVPPFALAAGAQLTYYAIETPSPTAQAIVVRQDSPIRTVAQLKGQRVAFAKGAGAHYLLVEALAEAGLSVRDIEPAYLTPADARAAFERGSVAAWVIWDPFLAAVQRQANARILRDGTKLASYRRFYLAATPYAKRRPDVLAVVYDELRRAGDWIKRNPGPAAAWHAPLIGLDPATVEAANLRRTYQVQAVDAASLEEQQRIADAFAAQSILPRKVTVAASPVWKPV
ncbi:sulfonate transport system substrate-binding protein [Cupriavidus sp. OV038]|jgi:sulfonate transport system substrate-binding protein|uniref:aliphatic sulfonate ABC transporter substrate-binding protein n=1 Tax=unclassified Cupriavidus TaxID=2640874 RepID=UPI0008E93029|nr:MULTISPECIES: aliphatic sulfonate ABC transporter substrate-binding protein [unclassified Cupriavidus]SFC99854.1 sulfonate transport system substrate-binding protein [Cupriavidus sp. OV038]SFP61389.1 sulfonate transport system substrate-binding protein [Cupriavidus sp. OV096]